MNAQQNWVDKAEKFARDRARIRQVLHAGGSMHLGQICNEFIYKFRYLPKGIERRLRELAEKGEVFCRIENGVPYYLLNLEAK